MLTPAFATGVFVLFALLLAAETWTDPAQPRLRQYGLARRLVAGNWPAKVGARACCSSASARYCAKRC